jgi:hypothetical protein
MDPLIRVLMNNKWIVHCIRYYQFITIKYKLEYLLWLFKIRVSINFIRGSDFQKGLAQNGEWFTILDLNPEPQNYK